jgi:hydroxymethylbilane synthase
MKTTGDIDQRTALHKFNEKALWTQDLEILLQRGELDLIVHSLKDMPTQLPHDLELGCVTKRKDPRDALVIKPSLADRYHSLSDLPEGSVIGTSSLRRIAQLKQHYPHLKCEDVRGNIGTRLAKLDNPDSAYSAIVIAVVGLLRLGQTNRIASYLSKDSGGMLYAVGQGALGIETRIGDTRVQELLSKIGCDRTTREALVERSLMRTLEGGCSVPIGVETSWIPKRNYLTEGSGIGIKPAEDYNSLTGVATSSPENSERPAPAEEGEQEAVTDEMALRAIVISLDGSETAEVETRKIVRTRGDAEQFGWDAARLLVEKGAGRILEGIQLNRGIIKEQGEA